MRKIFIALFKAIKDLILITLAIAAILCISYAIISIIISFSIKSILLGVFIAGFLCMWIYQIIKAR